MARISGPVAVGSVEVVLSQIIALSQSWRCPAGPIATWSLGKYLDGGLVRVGMRKAMGRLPSIHDAEPPIYNVCSRVDLPGTGTAYTFVPTRRIQSLAFAYVSIVIIT